MSVDLLRRRIISEPVDRPPGSRPTVALRTLPLVLGARSLAPEAETVEAHSRRCQLVTWRPRSDAAKLAGVRPASAELAVEVRPVVVAADSAG